MEDDPNDQADFYFQDTKALRRSMFICQHERDDHVASVKLKRLGWLKKQMYLQDNDESYDLLHIETFPAQCRPLCNADILEHITMHLVDSELLKCRLVCKYWSIEMACFLAKRKSVVITEEDNATAESFLKKRASGQPIAVSKLGLFDVNPNATIYKKIFHVFGHTISTVNLEDCNLSSADLRKMLLINAPNIENFHLREEHLSDHAIGRSRPAVSNTFKQMKSLNKGSICFPKMKMLHWDERNCHTDLKDFIEACPNLVTLELRNFPLPRSYVYKNLKWDSLRSLFLSPKDVLEYEHCKALAHLNLNLEKLTLFGLNSSDQKTMKSLSKFLSTLAENLTILELWLDYGSVLSYYGRSEHYSPLTVALPKVTKLHTESEILGHISNLRKMPAIEELEVVSNHHEHQNWNALTKRAALAPYTSNLRSFRCGDIDSKSLNKMIKIYPTITVLSIYATHVDDKVLRLLFTNLTQLIELTISADFKTNRLSISDSGLVGIPVDKCAKIRRDLNKYDDAAVQKWQSQPHIANLKCLQKLDLAFSTSDMVTDMSIVFGISKLVRLNTLKLPICQVTDVSLSVIATQLELLIVFGIAGCKQISDKGISDFKAKRKGVIVDQNLPVLGRS